MCRSIMTLAHLAPPATPDEVRAAAVQYVRKLSGSARPSAANAAAFDTAVEQVAQATAQLLGDWRSSAPPRDREVEAARRRARAAARRT